MNNILITTIISAISITVLWITYQLLFKNSNRFVFNRYWILGSILFSLLLPAIRFSNSASNINSLIIRSFNLKEIIITAQDIQNPDTVNSAIQSNSLSSHFSILYTLYVIGIAITSAMFILKLSKIAVTIIQSEKTKKENHIIVYTHKDHGPYSFLNYIFVTDKNVDPCIIRHELSHISHRHTLDVFFTEIAIILQWFNPFVYLFKRELQSLHEYAADNDVISSGIDRREYMMLILNQSTNLLTANTIGNNFSLLTTKKRIKMMTNNQKSKRMMVKVLCTLPILGLLVVVSCVGKNSQKAENKNVSTATEQSATNSDSVYSTAVGFSQLDEQPSFPNGMEGLQEYLKDAIVYPEEARLNNIEGKVFVQFIIEKDGSINEVTLLKGIDDACDEVALNAVRNMPNWNPGKVSGELVRTHFTLPIHFALQ